MVKYREIPRLTAMGISQRNVAFSLGRATSTVQDALRAARATGLARPLLEEMNTSPKRPTASTLPGSPLKRRLLTTPKPTES
ncbi:MAG: hypothetical protein IKF78_10600 [Atopobiaceae bacterium]|nr:hypothetical protein [Atopobiaceae bacterium]